MFSSFHPAARPTGFAIAIFLAALGSAPRATLAEGPIILRDVTQESGITFRHTDGGSGRYYIVETVASGLATFDYDGDGLIDIYFLNGRPLRGTKPPDPPPKNRLYRNVGGFRFVDVTDKAGVGDAGYGLGVAVGDYDNDGWPDIYVNNYGPNVLYHNNGDG
ncbi:MAG: FG-GAP repeat domain-containing protein, partial [Thermoguttaceae bacterium]